jgi:Cyclin, N-terminal domain
MLPSSEIVETIQVMLRQEADYSVRNLRLRNDGLDGTNITVNGRAKMVEWCCRVMSYCNLEIEIVSIAMNYTDRMCICQPQILTNACKYQLVAMTALYTAAKIHAPEALDPKLVSSLSRGTYTAEEIEEQEKVILASLQWKMNPPTAHSMVRQYVELVRPTLAIEEQEAVVSFALKQIDKYVCNHYCSSVIRESVVAYCAFMNALGYLSILTSNDKNVAFRLGYNLSRLINLDIISDDILISKAQIMLGSTSTGSKEQTLEHPPRRRECKRTRIGEDLVNSTLAGQQRHRSPVLILER